MEEEILNVIQNLPPDKLLELSEMVVKTLETNIKFESLELSARHEKLVETIKTHLKEIKDIYESSTLFEKYSKISDDIRTRISDLNSDTYHNIENRSDQVEDIKGTCSDMYDIKEEIKELISEMDEHDIEIINEIMLDLTDLMHDLESYIESGDIIVNQHEILEYKIEDFLRNF